MAKRHNIALAMLITVLAGGCASDDMAANLACSARQQACFDGCDRNFEYRADSWEYQACTDRCREQTQRAPACTAP